MAGTIRRVNIPGYAGGTVIATTATVDAPARRAFTALHIITETVIDEVEGNLTNVGALEGATLPAGAVIPGRFTSVKLTSGLVVAVLD